MTDKLRSYAAAKREVVPSVPHCQEQYANNRAEVSHEHTREQERQMRALNPTAMRNDSSLFTVRFIICFDWNGIF